MAVERLAVVIPCHRRWDLLVHAVDAVSDWPVIVVNDAPPNHRPAMPDGVFEVRTRGGEGFARAVNAGLQAAQQRGASHVLLLNDDARPSHDCIAQLCAAWQEDVGAVGPVLLDADGQVESAGVSVRWWGRVVTNRVIPTGTVDVGALSGACLLVASDVRLDTSFAHGFEDFALCRTLQCAGKRVLLVGEARCHHHGGATVNRRRRQAQRHAVSGHLRLLEHRRYLPVVTALAVAQVIREGGPWERVLGIAEGIWDWRSG